jgi:predicted lipid-binding transport protein (Tim44 family)
MGMLGLLLAALIIGVLVILQMRGPSHRPAQEVQKAAAEAKVDASNYANLLKDVKTKTDAASQKEAARVQEIQQSQDAP